jgi:hypothetical protein
MACIDWQKGRKMRAELLEKGASPDSVVLGLSGVVSPDALEERRELIKRGADKSHVLKSLAGDDSPEAWTMRRDLFDKCQDHFALGCSLAGLDSGRSWNERWALIDLGLLKGVAVSLVGFDAPWAWDMRRKLLDESIELKWIALSLAGVDSQKAEDMREYLLGEGMDIRPSLVGLGAEKHWEERDEQAELFLYPEAKVVNGHAESLVGGYMTSVWRLRKQSPEKQPVPVKNTAELELLNLVHNPSLETIQTFHIQHPRPSSGLSEQQSNVLVSAMLTDRESALDMLSTTAAVPDRAPARLAEELLRRMLPERAKAPEPSMWNRFASEFGGSGGPPSLSSAFEERSSLNLMGAGAEDLKDKRTLVEARDAMDALLVSGIYGRYDDSSRRWQKTFFPARRESPAPSRETTLTLKNVSGAGRVSLPLPLDARLVKERVKGLTSKKKEIALTVTSNALGEAVVEVPGNVVSILYSIEQPIIPEPLPDPSAKEMDSFKRAFERDYGREMSDPLAILPHDVEAEVRSSTFKALSPKRQLMRVEEIVRKLGWYDTENQEVSGQKSGKAPEDQIVICEERMEDLRARRNEPGMAKKKFAGVCADFAVIAAALLRKAGFPAGIIDGIHLTGTSAAMHDLHATAFVPWPDGRGGIRIVPVDGTPSSAEEIAADVARPTLAEWEATASKAIASEVAIAEEVIAGLVEAAHANDVATIRKLTNSKLEQALNVILQYEVKASHLHTVERVLDAYWYGGLRRADRVEEDIVLRQALEEEVIRARKASVEPSAEPAGTQLLETVRDFIRKFQRGGAARTPSDAFDILDRIARLAQGELSDVERRALAVTITYLRAEKMR